MVPATDGTGTTVNQTGERFDIDGGTHSTDAQNLFHSFEVFSLEVGEQANFITQPSVQNVLARVRGGVPSILNGLLQISGESSPNLFLLNPAGVLFGAEARLNLPGNLTVTTADAVGFSQGWFNAVGENAVGDNNYSALLGAPTGEFVFLSDRPGSIVNEGALSLSEDAALTLMGGNVVNTGSLAVPGGVLTLVALPDGEHVRLSQAGSLLSLELSMLSPDEATGVNVPTLTPLDLPALLTMTAAHSASALTVDADGSVRLTARPDQTTVQVSERPGSATLSGDISVEAVVGEQAVGGAIAVVGDRIALFDAALSASGNDGGGTIRIGGDYRGGESLPHAQHTWIDVNSVLTADAHEQGTGGQVIVWADDTTQHLGHISATGGMWAGDGGFVEVSGKSRLRFQGTVDTRAEHGQVGSLLLDPEDIIITSTFNAAHDTEILDGNIFASDGGSESFFISENTLESLSGSTDVTLEATNDITIQDLDDDLLDFFSGNSITIKADADGNGAGSVFMDDTNDTLAASGRSLTLSGNQLALGNLDTSGAEIGGNITLISGSSVSTGNLLSAGFQQGGNLSISAPESIFVEDADTSSSFLSGDIDIVSQAGDITTGSLFVGDNNGDIGSVNLTAPGVI
ncbi:MAG: filamentous hemagglutinin N-terminal domain-containing protein, partial [Cyanobacteria bacterium J06607_13]